MTKRAKVFTIRAKVVRDAYRECVRLVPLETNPEGRQTMHPTRDITLDASLFVMLRDVGLVPEDACRLAGLSSALLRHETIRVSVKEYFALLQAIEDLADDPLLPIRLVRSARTEIFSAPIFAALCSSTLVVAAERMAAHKRLVAPMTLTREATDETLVIGWRWNDPTIQSPRLMMAIELVFLTQLVRIATRRMVIPLRVTCPVELAPGAEFRDFFGVAPVRDAQLSITFSTRDALRPFVTENETLWASFAPELRRHMRVLDASLSMAERTESVLLACLSSGEAIVERAARRLGVSPRTLQRRLADEGTTFRDTLRGARRRLALHYLERTALPYDEIAFLLGFTDTSSFFRAFHEWSGATPGSVRALALTDGGR